MAAAELTQEKTNMHEEFSFNHKIPIGSVSASLDLI